MILLRKPIVRSACAATLFLASACGFAKGIDDSENAVITPPEECSPTRPDCSVGTDFPVQEDLNAMNSSGVRYSPEANALVIDRASGLPDEDGDGVPDDADECLGQPGWRMPCDGDASDDGIFQTLFFDASGSPEARRTVTFSRTVEIPKIDLYFLVDGTFSMAGEISVLQSEIANVISDVELLFDDPWFGVGLAREYPVPDVAAAESQAPYHHVLDLTDDTALFAKAISTLNTVRTTSTPEAVAQALYSVATGQGLGEFVPNRAPCPSAGVGYPCFRPDAFRVILNITDAPMFNGPRPLSPTYDPFPIGVGDASLLPPAEMFPALFDADDALSALDLGDISTRSLTLLGMSTLLTDAVNTVADVGCMSPPVLPGGPMDGKDAVITFRFDSPPSAPFAVSSSNTHWPGAVLALFDSAALDPLMSLDCQGQATWNSLSWSPVSAQQYYLVADGQFVDMTSNPEGAFSLAIEHDGDPANPSWLTADAPVDWPPVETNLLANNIRVASVISPFAGMLDADPDARAVASITGAITKTGVEWVEAITADTGDGLGAAVSNTISLIVDESIYDHRIAIVEDSATLGFDENEFVVSLSPTDCAVGQMPECGAAGAGPDAECLACEPGADISYDLVLANTTVAPLPTGQFFDLEVVVTLDGVVELERIPVRILVPDQASHEFDSAPAANFYFNSYNSLDRCDTPPERPDWDTLTWTGSASGGSSIEFQIRTANTEPELDLAVPVTITVPVDTTDTVFDLRQMLIDNGMLNGLPFLRVTAVLNPSPDFLSTPQLSGWQVEFSCFAAD